MPHNSGRETSLQKGRPSRKSHLSETSHNSVDERRSMTEMQDSLDASPVKTKTKTKARMADGTVVHSSFVCSMISGTPAHGEKVALSPIDELKLEFGKLKAQIDSGVHHADTNAELRDDCEWPDRSSVYARKRGPY